VSGGRWSVAPVLPVADVVRALVWYERLGFAVAATYDGYAILTLEGVELHLAEQDPSLGAVGPGPEGSSSGAYLRVADADAVFERWSALGAPVVAPPADQPYGVREFATEDPDGNLWRVGSWLPDETELGWSDGVASAESLAPGGRGGPEADLLAGAAPGSGAARGLAAEPGPEPSVEPGLEAEPDLLAEARAPGDDEPADGGRDAGPPCPGCGWRLGSLPARALGAEARDVAHEFGELLRAADDDEVRARPGPTTWSALEYGVHVRDVLTTYADRIVRTLTQDRPELAAWDQEEPIADGMANESDRDAVADDLGRNASHLSAALRMVGDDDWGRSATLHHPGAPSEVVTIEDLARRVLHECVHHLADARAALSQR
jgi:uncharacterized glyoxalase superfamily protein PhnB